MSNLTNQIQPNPTQPGLTQPTQPTCSVHTPTDGLGASRFVAFTRDEWWHLRDQRTMALTEADLFAMKGVNEQMTLSEVEQIYLPLTRLLSMYFAATQVLRTATHRFLGNPEAKLPFVLGIGGSVAVGKSTVSRVLQTLLSQLTDHPRVDLVTTDGFLYPNAVLEERGIMHRKGFPESYDVRRALEFLIDVKSGKSHVTAPVYSHLTYDIVPGSVQEVNRPDIMIFEGLNVLQGPQRQQGRSLAVSDFFDFSIYIDADAADIERWYIDRFMTLRETVFTDLRSYFHKYSALSDAEALVTARRIWRDVNYVNLKENIEPTRERAHLILRKDAQHEIASVWLRKL